MFYEREGRLFFSRRGETVCIYAQGRDALRVRATMNASFEAEDWALAGVPQTAAQITISKEAATIRSGAIELTVSRFGQMRFYNNGRLVLEEYYRMFDYDTPHTPSVHVVAREYRPIPGGEYAFCQRFESADEKLFGMGQYQQPQLNLKGCTLELAQRNSQVSVPFLLSSRGPPSAALRLPQTSRSGVPKAFVRPTIGSRWGRRLVPLCKIIHRPWGVRPPFRKTPWDCGSVSCATARRKRCLPSRANITAAAFRWMSS